MTVPFLSLGMMIGDAHVEVLERCLNSVLKRTGGPLVDEIVLGWNGSNTAALEATLHRLEYDGGMAGPGPLTSARHPNWPPIILVAFKWPGRFDAARNTYWKHCQGEWILWLDGDDEVADAGTPTGLKAIEQVERDYGIPPMPAAANETVTLKNWLASLPLKVNVVFAPYDYARDANGYVLVRQKMKRLVRRSAGHVWYSPEQSGIHEMLTCLGGVPETMAETFGLLVQHSPSEAELVRVTRNKEIVEALTGPSVLSDPRHAYDVANAALVASNLAQANEAISQAIIHAHNDMDRYTYRLARAYIGMAEGNAEKMLQEALAAVGTLPEIRDAYFVACDAYYRLGKWTSVIEWFERGVSKQPTLLQRDQPLAAFTAPRAQAAMAYSYIGLKEKALALVEEMEKEYPKSELTREAGTRVRALIHQQNGEAAMFTSLDFIANQSPWAAAQVIHALKQRKTFDALRAPIQWAAMEHRITNAAANGPRMVLEGETIRLVDGGVITVDDVLNNLEYPVQLLDAEQAADRRAVKVKTQARVFSGPPHQHIAFYAPTGITRWQCSDFKSDGMGGSESSVALLAKELTNRGHFVTVFTNKRFHPITTLWDGVIEKDCSQFRPDEWMGDDIVVFCRAPWMARENPPATKNVWCWHQDNGYGNKWLWNEDLLKRQGQFFVSHFAAGSLLHDAGVAPDAGKLAVRWAVLGNGIEAKWNVKSPVDRGLTVMYASNPSRGLAMLLDAWPLVLKEVPEAALNVACEWNVMLQTTQAEPGLGIAQQVQQLKERLITSPRTTNLGWLQQEALRAHLLASKVYAYPGGPMPEGFGVVLVQAEAAGCRVVAPQEGALPEVLSTKATSWLPAKTTEAVAATIVEALRAPSPLQPVLGRHYWSAVADRFLAATEPIREAGMGVSP